MREYYLIVGCARSGVATAKFLLAKGHKVILTDTKDLKVILDLFPEVKDFIDNPKIRLVFGKQADLEVVDIVKEIVLSPGVPLDLPILIKAKNEKISIISELELAYRYSNAPIIAITGTNGKTTTTTLVGEIFKNSGRGTYVVGNIGDPMIKYVDSAGPEDIFIAEISSFQLETISKFRPKISTILNLSPDHLDRHKTMDNYVDAKFRIIENCTGEDMFLVNLDDPLLSTRQDEVKCRLIGFSTEKKVSKGAYLDDNIIKIADNDTIWEICHRDELKIPGIHNVSNALAAVALAYFGGVSVPIIRESLIQFSGVEHRLEFVRELNGIRFVNDSKGTNTDASIIAIKAINTPIVLIGGGYDKNVEFTQWIESFKEKVKYLVVVGATSEKIVATANTLGYKNAIRKNTFEEAVLQAYDLAQKGDTVLLSPACASWGMFKDFEERGRVFKEIVNHLGGK